MDMIQSNVVKVTDLLSKWTKEYEAFKELEDSQQPNDNNTKYHILVEKYGDCWHLPRIEIEDPNYRVDIFKQLNEMFNQYLHQNNQNADHGIFLSKLPDGYVKLDKKNIRTVEDIFVYNAIIDWNLQSMIKTGDNVRWVSVDDLQNFKSSYWRKISRLLYQYMP